MLTLNTRFYKHWSEIPRSIWIWENFTPKEIASKGDGSILIDVEALNKLQALRNSLGKPLIIKSAYRDPGHNTKVGGAKNSNHLKGKAFDVSLHNQDKELLYGAAKACGFSGFGHYNSFLHLDTGKQREWNG